MDSNRKLKLIPIFCLFILFFQDAISQKKQQPYHLYLLIGQSNMAGRGEVGAIDREEHPRVIMLTRDYQWENAGEPVQFDKPGIVGVGPGLAFGKAMAEKNPEAIIGLIPAAVGGSSIRVWRKERKHDQTQIYPFDEAVNRATYAARKGTLKGIIWHQGESDSKPGLSEVYKENLINFVWSIRNALGHPDLPFVAGELPRFFVKNNEQAKSINRAVEQAKENLNNYSFVKAGDFNHIGDGTHLDAPSARELGQKYAGEMHQLIQNQ